MRENHISKLIFHEVPNENYSIEDRVGTVFIQFGYFQALLGLFLCLITHAHVIGCIAVAVYFLFIPFTMYLSKRRGHYSLGRMITVALVCIGMPIIYVTSGGVNSGCGFWLCYQVFFIAIASEGIWLFLWEAVAIVLDLFVFYLGLVYPERIRSYSDTLEVSISVVGSYLVVIVSIIGTVLIYKSYYNREREKLIEKTVALEEINASQRKFLANMSHGIRTPINAIMGFSELSLRTDSMDEMKSYAEDISDASDVLLRLVDNILDFTKIETNHLEIVEENYYLAAVIQECYKLVCLRADKKNLPLLVKANPNLPRMLRGDSVRITQIAMNLLMNAIKYTEKGSVIFAVDSVQKSPDEPFYLKMVVIDSGIGIDKEDMERIFASFQRADLEHNQHIEGNGLGLTIVKQLLDAMGGTIHVDSDKGKGSTFTVLIPQKVISYEHMGEISVGSGRRRERTPVSSKNAIAENKRGEDTVNETMAGILLVDDVEANLRLLQGLLRKTGLPLDTASRGAEAVQKAKDKHYDLILMDIMMPEMSGIEALHEIRKFDRDVPVIALTADAVAGAEGEYLAEGFQEYMTKPVKPKELEELVNRYLRL